MTAIQFALPTYPPLYKAEVAACQMQKAGTFHTHISERAELLHKISETVLLPARLNAQLLGKVIHPLAGANKGNILWGVAIRISALVLWILSLPVALLSVVLGFPLRSIDHCYRPIISFFNNSANPGARTKSVSDLVMTKDQPLHVRTHNLGLVPTSISGVIDLRHPLERAQEIVDFIVNDPKKPDIIFFQEAFNEDAVKLLCEGIKHEYPFIIHNVAPEISGINSGTMVASKYPIQEVKFQRFRRMLPPESMSPRGIIKVRLESTQGPVLLYGVHTQALIGENSAQVRVEQIEEIKNRMAEDAKQEPGAAQIVVGDFNTSRINAWGKDNRDPKGQAEEEVLDRLAKHFDDLYLRDHDPLHGKRTKDEPCYLHIDNERMDEKNLVEPSATWYHGPLANSGSLLSWKMIYESWKYKRPLPKKVKDITILKSTWGTPEWRTQQVANTSIFDYILIPRIKGDLAKPLDGRVEIRRIVVPKGAQSASSDHLPVDGQIFFA